MKPGAHIVLRGAVRFYMPIVVLLALSVLATRPSGGGVGLIAGLGAALALALHVLMFGAGGARAAFPPWLARALMAAGLLATLASAGLGGAGVGPQLGEAGLFAVTAAGAAFALKVLVGRAPTLRDEDW
jgi:hypothetical protein